MLSLIAALLVENRAEHILSEMLPKFNALLDNTDFTFSMKLRLIESFNIIPIQLIRSADIIRKIRNAFAHDITNRRFKDLNEKLLKDLINYREYIYRNKETKEQQTKYKESYFESYKSLSWYCIIGLDSYIENAEEFAIRSYSMDSVECMYKENDAVKNGITNAFFKLAKGEQKIIGNFLVAKTEDDTGFLQELKPKRPFKVGR
jgi:hypothetical protein